MKKERLDNLLVDKGYFSSRSRAKAAIMAGQVLVDDKLVDKAGRLVGVEQTLRLKEKPCPYVSRGGYKLERAQASFNLDFTGKSLADIGASTGGFSHLALMGGAQKVYSIDVGYGQLAWSLRQDPRVVVMERTNARYLTPADLGELVDMVVTDVSFISLTKIFPAAYKLLNKSGEMVALIKPQFEAGRDRVGKKGVVREAAVHQEVIDRLVRAAREEGFFLLGLDYSPITGPQGNIEYLLYLTKAEPAALDSDKDLAGPAALADLVSRAHDRVKKKKGKR